MLFCGRRAFQQQRQSLAQSWASRLLTADSLAENLQSWVKEPAKPSRLGTCLPGSCEYVGLLAFSVKNASGCWIHIYICMHISYTILYIEKYYQLYIYISYIHRCMNVMYDYSLRLICNKPIYTACLKPFL